jgi:hypothetical protein
VPGPVPDQKFELVGPFAEVHEQIPGLLNGPGSVRVGRDAEDVHVAAADLDHEEHVRALEGERAVHVEEVAGQHGRRLACGGTAARWCGRGAPAVCAGV